MRTVSTLKPARAALSAVCLSVVSAQDLGEVGSGPPSPVRLRRSAQDLGEVGDEVLGHGQSDEPAEQSYEGGDHYWEDFEYETDDESASVTTH